ncbi:MAG: serine O-acetyltransferase [Terriglobia bacterium]
MPEPTSVAEADRLQTPHLRAGEFVWNLQRLSWNETLARARADHRRIVSLLATHKARPRSRALFHPSFVCAFLYRISNHWFRAGHPHLARFVWHLNFLLTGADVDPRADLGEGLVILSPPGTTIMGTAGRNLTVMPCAGLGGAVGRSVDIGAGPGLPFLGDDVILEPHCGVLGPARVGHRVRVGAGIALSQDVPDDTLVELPKPRFLRRRDLP